MWKKKISCLVLWALLVAGRVDAAESGAATAPVSVEQWGVFEVALRGPADGNPFVEVRCGAIFCQGDRTMEVTGFYDGDGVYRIRFMPDALGEWQYTTQSNRTDLAGQRGSVQVTPASHGNHGPVRVRNTYHFGYADGTPFRPIGTTIYNWLDTPDDVQEQTLRTLATAPFNKVRMLVTQQPEPYAKKFAPARWPFAGTAPHGWDYTRFNPDFFRHYEQRIAQLRDLGIEADIILYNPYGKWGFEAMDAAGDERYVRYVVARFGAYRNVWWSLANEYDFLKTKQETDWDRLGALVQQCDPYHHLRSIHNGHRIYNHSQPWVTHVSMQNGAAVADSGRAELYRDVWQKPVVYDEVKYEGDSTYRWGNLSGPEMVHRFWCGTVAGTYVGHGDYFHAESNDTWTSFGGTLKGESAPRLAFLRQILEDTPPAGINPIDQWQDPYEFRAAPLGDGLGEPHIGGKAGEYYLVYFGRSAPKSWALELYKKDLTEGLRFKAEVLDTWAMTVTPLDGVFTLKRQGDYNFTDANGREIPLPGKPYVAVRLRRVP